MTCGGSLRNTSFHGLQDDEEPQEVVWQEAMDAWEMSDTTARIIDTIIAFDATMPAIFEILARQDPQGREEPCIAQAYAIDRCTVRT